MGAPATTACPRSGLGLGFGPHPTRHGSHPWTSPHHRWKFHRVGGLDQVSLDRAEDLRNLGTLDQKLWVALSCPVQGLELDPRTLALLDTDKDGRVRAPGGDRGGEAGASRGSQDLEAIIPGAARPPARRHRRRPPPEGKALLGAARQILAAPGSRTPTEITPGRRGRRHPRLRRDHLQRRRRGDPRSAAEGAVPQAIVDAMACAGERADRSGAAGHRPDAAGGLLRRPGRLRRLVRRRRPAPPPRPWATPPAPPGTPSGRPGQGGRLLHPLPAGRHRPARRRPCSTGPTPSSRPWPPRTSPARAELAALPAGPGRGRAPAAARRRRSTRPGPPRWRRCATDAVTPRLRAGQATLTAEEWAALTGHAGALPGLAGPEAGGRGGEARGGAGAGAAGRRRPGRRRGAHRPGRSVRGRGQRGRRRGPHGPLPPRPLPPAPQLRQLRRLLRPAPARPSSRPAPSTSTRAAATSASRWTTRPPTPSSPPCRRMYIAYCDCRRAGGESHEDRRLLHPG